MKSEIMHKLWQLRYAIESYGSRKLSTLTEDWSAK